MSDVEAPRQQLHDEMQFLIQENQMDLHPEKHEYIERRLGHLAFEITTRMMEEI